MTNHTKPIVADADAINRAADLLRQGRLVAFPTETVYGLGADAGNPVAVAGIFKAKGRPADHPLIVYIADIDRLDDWASCVPDDALKLAEQFWPGPLAMILNKQPQVPLAVELLRHRPIAFAASARLKRCTSMKS